MTDSPTRCAECDRELRPDDRFCGQCGHPTPLNPEARASGPSPVGLDEPPAPGPDDDITIREDIPSPPAALASKIAFHERFAHVLGEEFALIALLGQGGFARVYKARDQRLDRVVAIKVIQPDLVGAEPFMETFRNEGVALAKLRHPGIVPIYDIRERGGLIYSVMPFVEGSTLEERLERGRLPPYESRRILSELADALSAAHRANMVHMDIKPDNVFLEGDHQKALLLDFGIAMAIAEKVPESGGPVVGTPSYMSPEQARGLPDIDHRSDIYSLGALGYRMLMGRPPILARTIEEAAQKHASQTPVPIRDINPSIPKDFADAIMKCLEKDPWNRFSTTKELGAILDAVTFSTERDTTPQPVSSGKESNVIALVATGLALLVGVMIGWAIG